MTAPSRGSSCSTCPAAPCSTTPRPAPARTIRWTCSTASSSASPRPPSAMPRRDDIHKILILGSGPIVIGQAAEFDYSGVQACKVLREEGYEVVLVNSNPATIMTDPEFADATYIEPLLPGPVAQVIERERPDALLGTLGGQTALNLSKALHDDGTLERFGVELIGANYGAIACAEDRDLFREAMAKAGLRMPNSEIVTSIEEARAAMTGANGGKGSLGLPCIVRPAYTLGGRGGGIARTEEEFARIVAQGLEASPIGQVLLDESVIGWGEFELEVMRDSADNVVIVCSIENVDPMGLHTGDAVTVAPQQTLTDHLYQQLRDQALTVIRAVGVETGGSNVQFAVNPDTDEILVIEMNPRVSRSSALASKATGFPIAKIAARLAVGYRLDEVANDITGKTPACFEPSIDYVVTKVPRWAFEKLPGAVPVLGTRMQSVGEVMAIGRTFPESLQKAIRSLEVGREGLNADLPETALEEVPTEQLLADVAVGTPDRLFHLEALLRRGVEIETLSGATGIDPWFLAEMARITDARMALDLQVTLGVRVSDLDRRAWKRLRRLGFADAQLAYLFGPATTTTEIAAARLSCGVVGTFKTVDTCAAEFEAH